jgi:hypothetical protein
MMMKTESLIIDKSTWGAGPWENEPDRFEWEHLGFPCLAVRNESGCWCGYVAVPPTHPLHGKDYDDVDVGVHGGLTYANKCQGHICYVPKPGEPDDVWWFGFDCAHSGDFRPEYHSRFIHYGYPFSSELYDHARAIKANTWTVDVYRTLEYVREQTETLVQQLQKASG